jgi:hypothetical protein
MLPFLDVPRPRFNPLRLPGLAAWYDAADSSTVLTTVSPDVPATDGQTVRRWMDKSGNNRHLDQADLALQPAFELAGLNGRPAILPDGVNDFLLSGAYNVSASASLFVVMHDPAPAGNFKVAVGGNKPTAPTFDMGKSDAQNFYFSANTTVSGGAMVTIPFVGSAVVGDGTCQMWRNKTSVFNSTLVSGGSNSIRLFSSLTNSFNWTGRLSEVMIYESKITPEQAGRLQDYLIRKWGITA